MRPAMRRIGLGNGIRIKEIIPIGDMLSKLKLPEDNAREKNIT
jgi:hypothetical protein